MKYDAPVFFEIPPLEEDDFFVLTDHTGAVPDHPAHWHLDYELAVIHSSGCLRTAGDSHETVTGVDLVLAGPRLLHQWQAVEAEDFHFTTLHFHGDFICCHTVIRRVFSRVKDLLERSGSGISFADEVKSEACDRILDIQRSDSAASALDFLSLLHFLACSPGQRVLASESYRPPVMAALDSDRRIRLVSDYVDMHYSENLKLADIAHLAGMAQSAFCHFFKKQTGESFVDYLNCVRAGHAARMLCCPEGTIADVARACGFRDMSNFIREFRKRMCTTPSHYRSQALKKVRRV